MELWFFKHGKYLAPADEESEEAIRNIAQGEAFAIKIKRSRNSMHWRKYRSLVRLVYDNQDKFAQIEHLYTAIKIAAGWYWDGPIVNGTPSYIPRPLNFWDTDQTEFEEFYPKALEAIIVLLPQFNAQFLLEAVAGYGR